MIKFLFRRLAHGQGKVRGDNMLYSSGLIEQSQGNLSCAAAEIEHPARSLIFERQGKLFTPLPVKAQT